MALNINLIKQLYEELGYGEKTKLLKYVWPKYRTGMRYFDHTNRPSYEVIEKLADSLGVTIDSLRLDPLATQTCLPGTDLPTKRRSTCSLPEDAEASLAADANPKYDTSSDVQELKDKNKELEHEILRLKELANHLEEKVRLKDEVVTSKNDQIKLLLSVMERLN